LKRHNPLKGRLEEAIQIIPKKIVGQSRGAIIRIERKGGREKVQKRGGELGLSRVSRRRLGKGET